MREVQRAEGLNNIRRAKWSERNNPMRNTHAIDPAAYNQDIMHIFKVPYLGFDANQLALHGA